MSKRAEGTHFQKSWMDTCTHESSGTVACPVAPASPSFTPPLLFYRINPHSGLVPLILYCTTIDSRFIEYITRVYDPGRQGGPLLSSIIVSFQNESPFWGRQSMCHQELLTTAITVRGEVQGHNTILEKEIVLELLP